MIMVLDLINYIIVNFIHTLIDAIFATRCIACGKGQKYLCAQCTHTLLPAKQSDLPTDMVAIWDYNQKSVKKLIWLLKYRGVRSIAQIFAQAIYDRLIDNLADQELYNPSNNKWLLIPIPLGPKRRRQRGFNQSEEIAKYLLRLNSRDLESGYHLLKRPKDTPLQTSLRRRVDRQKNLIDAFTTPYPRELVGRNVIIIDDVTTTGTTIKEARQVLKQAGARRIIGCAVAHG